MTPRPCKQCGAPVLEHPVLIDDEIAGGTSVAMTPECTDPDCPTNTDPVLGFGP